jgi:ribosomal protein S14
MIDKNDSIVELGRTRKLYHSWCDRCGCDRGYKRLSLEGSGLCRVCFGVVRHTGKIVSAETRKKMSDNNYIKCGGTHPWRGRHHSEHTKKQLSDKQRDYCAAHDNQFVTGKSCGQHSEEVRVRLSKSNSGKEPRWKGRTFQYDGPKGYFKMRSSYELFYARWLDSQNTEWEYEPQFVLSNGKTFSPDFRLGNGVIMEIKGYWAKIGLEKWTLFCTDYPAIEKQVLMKNDLIQLGMKER